MKTRLDVLLVNGGYAKSREKAKALIKAGSVKVDGVIRTKSSELICEDALIEITGNTDSYVSRGAYKLKHALKYFGIDLSSLTCLDIGASTGGFTQVMLEHGAKKVYAVDVGHNQLDELLKADERVVSMEGINFRYFNKSLIADEIGFAAADVSFISLTLILDKAYEALGDNSGMVCLIKPQFEAGKEHIGSHGIVRDKKVHDKVIKRITEHCSNVGFNVIGVTESPIQGGDGNTEYLVYITKSVTATFTATAAPQ